uniref:Coiled-coil domain containing 50a n=1 Tax=Amphilophus citrinellus TaxID=61819 RepID=A0A3Q0RUB5_AMPCI
CRDFAVLEDHSLAYNLQEQEVESHLASNVYKNRLVKNDLKVAKKLQQEEDERAKIQTQKEQVDERQDNEIAQEIQEELVRQAEQQRQQEEKDAAIARKLQEKEMKEERRRQKQLETRFDEEYFEDHGTEYGLGEATKGLTKLDLREQELKDLEVARKLQEEEIKASQVHVRAAQMAQDEPPQPRTHDYENVNPGYVYPDHQAAPRAPTRPDPAY